MSKRFDVVIESKFKKDALRVTKQVTLSKKTVAHVCGVVSRNIPVKWQNGERVPLIGPEETLIISPPKVRDFRYCNIRVKSKADVLIICSNTQSSWEIRIPKSDDLGADAPATVNVTLAPDEPDDE